MTSNNEYADILSYLESQELPKKKAVGSPKDNRPIEVKKSRRLEASEKTKKLLDDSIEYYKDLPKVDFKPKSSGAFDVKRIEQMMHTRLVDDYKKRQSYERPYISCTELYTCLRKSYYVRKRYKIDLKKEFSFPYLYMIQKVGDLVHEIIQDLYNFDEVEKTIVSEPFKVKGRLDALGGNILYEIKTLDPSKFKGKYIKEHYFQGVIYAYILNSEYNYKIEKIVIVYFIRDFKSIHTFDLEPDESLAKSFLQRALVLQDSLAKNTPPDPIGAVINECKYCSYKTYCQKDKCDKVIQPFANKEPKEDKQEKRSAFLL